MSTRIVNNAVTAQQRSPATRDGCELPKIAINQLFGVMRLSYPSFLNGTSEADISATKKMWWSYLKDYDEQVVKKATDQVVVKHKKFAPTLGEFKELLEEVKAEPAFRPARSTKICDVCKSFNFTQHHHDVCITGKKQIFDVTDEQIAEAKKIFGKLR